MPLVDDRRGIRENQRGLGLALQAGHELPEIRLIVGEFHLMTPGGAQPLQVVQPAVEMHDVGLFADDPFLEVLEHIRTVAAVRRRADDVGLALEQLRDAGGIAQADGIADEHHLGQCRRRSGLGRGQRGPGEIETKESDRKQFHGEEFRVASTISPKRTE